jgi:cysteine desulfurase / selenocysteine lyase
LDSPAELQCKTVLLIAVYMPCAMAVSIRPQFFDKKEIVSCSVDPIRKKCVATVIGTDGNTENRLGKAQRINKRWRKCRRMPIRAYLNQAATSWPKAPGVQEAVLRCLQECPETEERSSGAALDAGRQCRHILVQMIGDPDPSRIIFTANATSALNIAIWGISSRLRSVVTSVTEHNSVLRPLHHLAQRTGARITTIPLTSSLDLDMEAFRQSLSEKPDLVVLNHASNVTGRVLDIGSCFRMAKQAGAITLLDASQSMGQIPVRAEELAADMIAFPGHKYLLGPAGTGALYVHPQLELEQFFVGGTGKKSELLFHPREMPDRLESGTPNEPGLSGWAAALKWQQAHHLEFQENGRRLFRQLQTGLQQMPGIQLIGSDSSRQHLGILSLRIKGWSVEDAGYALRTGFGVICRTGLHCAPLMIQSLHCHTEGTIRLSVAGNNTPEEVSYALEAFRAMLKSEPK